MKFIATANFVASDFVWELQWLQSLDGFSQGFWASSRLQVWDLRFRAQGFAGPTEEVASWCLVGLLITA